MWRHVDLQHQPALRKTKEGIATVRVMGLSHGEMTPALRKTTEGIATYEVAMVGRDQIRLWPALRKTTEGHCFRWAGRLIGCPDDGARPVTDEHKPLSGPGQHLAGKATLLTLPETAIRRLRENLSAMEIDPDGVVLTGGMAIWAYLAVFHHLHGRTKRIWYEDGRGERVLVAAHG